MLFVIGIVNLSYSGLILLEKYPDLQIIYSGQLDPQQQITTPINVTEGEQITISILTDSKNPLFFYIEGVNQEIIVENIFSEKFSFPFLTNQSGTHIIGVGNMGNTPLQIDNYVSENPILETEVIKELEGNSKT